MAVNLFVLGGFDGHVSEVTRIGKLASWLSSHLVAGNPTDADFQPSLKIQPTCLHLTFFGHLGVYHRFGVVASKFACTVS
jgi:hypothetical protein